MRGCVLFVFTFLLLPVLYAQEYGYVYDSGYSEDDLLGVDFHLYGASFHYAERISNNFFWGGEIGLLPDKYYWVVSAGKNFSQKNTIWPTDNDNLNIRTNLIQLFFLHSFIRWKPKNTILEIDGGFRYSRYWHHIPVYDHLDRTNFWGIFVKPVVGINKLKIGVRIDSGLMLKNNGNVVEYVLIATPLLRFNFK